MNAVTAENLSKTYPTGKKALDGISFSLKAGEIFGFLGPNGAGKTTTVKLLGGMLTPTSGTCRVFDMDPTQNPAAVHGISGFVTEHAQMYDNMTGLENLLFYGAVFGMQERDARRRALELLDRLSLIQAAKQKLASYSTGMRQRLSLARAMLHSPKILFLDEPTSGIDPAGVQEFISLIRQLRDERGLTVLFSSHHLDQVQQICDRVGLFSQGRLLADLSLNDLQQEEHGLEYIYNQYFGGGQGHE